MKRRKFAIRWRKKGILFIGRGSCTSTLSGTSEHVPAMRLVKSPELDVILDQSPIEKAIVSQTKDGHWVLTIRVHNQKSDQLEDYQLLTARGAKRLWSDPRPIFRLLRDHYNVKVGSFTLA